MFDGDTIFGLATGEVELTRRRSRLHAAATRATPSSTSCSPPPPRRSPPPAPTPCSAPPRSATGRAISTSARHASGPDERAELPRPSSTPVGDDAPGRARQHRAGETIAPRARRWARCTVAISRSSNTPGPSPTVSSCRSSSIRSSSTGRTTSIATRARSMPMWRSAPSTGVDAVYAPTRRGHVPSRASGRRCGSARSPGAMEGALAPGPLRRCHHRGDQTVHRGAARHRRVRREGLPAAGDRAPLERRPRPGRRGDRPPDRARTRRSRPVEPQHPPRPGTAASCRRRIPAALEARRSASAAGGERRASTVIDAAASGVLADEPLAVRVDYVAVFDADDRWQPVARHRRRIHADRVRCASPSPRSSATCD